MISIWAVLGECTDMRKVSRLSIGILTMVAAMSSSAEVIVDDAVVTGVDFKSFYFYSPNNAFYVETVAGGYTLVPQEGVEPVTDPNAPRTVIDGVEVPGVEVKQVYFDYTRSVFRMKTVQGGYTLAPIPDEPEPPPAGEFSLSVTSNPSEIELGGTATIAWQVSNAEYCEPRVGTPEWMATDITTTGGQADVMPTALGENIFRAMCEDADGNRLYRHATVNVIEPVNTGGPVSLSLMASPNEIELGESTTISWVASNAESCEPRVGTPEWMAADISTSGGQLVVTPSSAGEQVYRAACVGTDGTWIYRHTTVVVNPSQTQASCQDPSLDGYTDTWASVFGENFPEPHSTQVYFGIPRDGYRAVSFNSNSIEDNGLIATIETIPAGRLGAVSECPGDFDVAPECKWSWGYNGGIQWETDGSLSVTGGPRCKLKPNTTYYLNLTFTDGEDPDTSRCLSSLYSVCNTKLRHSKLAN